VPTGNDANDLSSSCVNDWNHSVTFIQRRKMMSHSGS